MGHESPLSHLTRAFDFFWFISLIRKCLFLTRTIWHWMAPVIINNRPFPLIPLVYHKRQVPGI